MTILNHYLQNAGIRQADFAKEIGIGQAMVSRLVRGNAKPSLALADKIERASKGAVPIKSWVGTELDGPGITPIQAPPAKTANANRRKRGAA
jgi:transcriptional regulator with XRE-family HTH domain